MTVSTVPFAVVVDDDTLVLMNASDILSDVGFRTLEASNGDQAKDIIEDKGESIVLLFTDVEMPGKTDGFALSRYVAEHWSDIEIVVASGRVKPEPGDMPEKATFLSKPFNAETIHDHLRETLPDGKKPEPLKQAV
ncbi:MAG: response regulator [Sphingomonas adhaesiva]|uniref:response regulator n=1 Tax=Sphingomonas adhaesiva TaxID=28212 RepID=UPI002FFCF8BC